MAPDSNVYRAKAKDRFRLNKEAFDEIIGDPFVKPEPIYGQYHLLHRRSSIAAARNNFDEGRGTSNRMKPSVVDFFCDVERVVALAINDENRLIKFTETYITEITETAFTPQERMELEQLVGAAFRKHGLSPVPVYFTTVRQKVGQK